MLAEPSVLAVASNAVLDACVALGLDRSALLEAADVAAEALADPDARLPASSADAIWRAAAAASEDPRLAVLAAEALPFGAYRVIDFLTAHAATIGEGLERVAAYFPLVDPRGALAWTPTPAGGARLSFVSASGRPLPRAAVEYTFVALVTRSRAGSGIRWSPRAVELSGASGSAAQHEALSRALGVAPSYAAGEDRLELAAQDWERPTQGANAALFAVLERHAELLVEALPAADDGLTRALREAISAELRAGKAGLERVARRLGCSGRTLQRRLDEQGLRYGAIVDEVKAERAKAYLDDRSLALCEVAFLLGFADQSAFTRAFKRWTGATPGRYRKRA